MPKDLEANNLYAYQSVRDGRLNDGRVTREHSSGGIVTIPINTGNLNTNYKTSLPFGNGNGPNVTINRKNNSGIGQ
jgi:hypothetical protein